MYTMLEIYSCQGFQVHISRSHLADDISVSRLIVPVLSGTPCNITFTACSARSNRFLGNTLQYRRRLFPLSLAGLVALVYRCLGLSSST